MSTDRIAAALKKAATAQIALPAQLAANCVRSLEANVPAGSGANRSEEVEALKTKVADLTCRLAEAESEIGAAKTALTARPGQATPSPLGARLAALTDERDASAQRFKRISETVKSVRFPKTLTQRAEEAAAAKGSNVATLESVTQQRNDAQAALAKIYAVVDELEKPSLTEQCIKVARK